MKRRYFLTILTLLGIATAQASGSCLPDGVQASGAKYRICMPDERPWNGDLVVYAHGYVAFNKPVAIPEDQLVLPDGTSLPAIVNGLGYAFAVSSYSINGLAVQEGIADLKDLVTIFKQMKGLPGRVYLVGPSEGGIITALSVERHPEVYSGGLAACGPIGDFGAQINYIGNFRAVFDYFFPNVLPGKADNVPAFVINNWDNFYEPLVKAAIKLNPAATAQLLSVTGAPVGLNPQTVEETVVGLVWYGVFTSNDATAKLGGQPFQNTGKIYSGSLNDFLLNLKIDRYAADPAAITEINAKYQTSGNLARPLVTMHTTGDHIIPYWNEPLYASKVASQGKRGLHVNLPVFRYGHCQFNAIDVLTGFATLVRKVQGGN